MGGFEHEMRHDRHDRHGRHSSRRQLAPERFQRETMATPMPSVATPVSQTAPAVPPAPTQRIYAFGLSREKIEKAIAHLKVSAIVVKDIDDASMVMTIKNYYRQGSARLRNAEERRLPIYVLRSSTAMQIERQLLDIFFPDQIHRPDEKPSALTTPEQYVQNAMLETEVAINQLLNGERSAVELTPQDSIIRRLQHQMAERYNMQSESRGREPFRRVKLSR